MSATAQPVARRWLQWCLIPLLVLALAEAFARRSVDRVPTWYAAAERLAAQEPVRVVFVGSSRTQAAIVTHAFEREVSRRGGGRVRALNLARGYSTDAEHYLGLRNLIAAQPQNLQGLTVFCEAPGGLPFPARFESDAWAFPQQPWMLVDLLRPDELGTFFELSGLDLETRLHVSLRVLLRPVALFNRRERLRQHWFERVLPSMAKGHWPDLTPNGELGQDLRGPGPSSSIRMDEAAVAVARGSAERLGRQMREQQAPFGSYAGTITEQLSTLVKQVHGRVAFYVPPQGRVFLEAYRTPVRQEDVRSFPAQARAWGGCVVEPDFRYSDEDLPDLWHLKRERAGEFTRAVAAGWLEHCAAAEALNGT